MVNKYLSALLTITLTLTFSLFHGVLASAQTAAAGAATPEGAPAWMQFVPLVAIFAVMYFLMIRPQAKKQKEHQNLIGSLKIGDQIVTQAGILGKISAINEQIVNLDIASGVQIKILRSQILGLQNTIIQSK